MVISDPTWYPFSNKNRNNMDIRSCFFLLSCLHSFFWCPPQINSTCDSHCKEEIEKFPFRQKNHWQKVDMPFLSCPTNMYTFNFQEWLMESSPSEPWLKHQTTLESGNHSSKYLISLNSKYLNPLMGPWNHVSLVEILRNTYLWRSFLPHQSVFLTHKSNTESWHFVRDIFGQAIFYYPKKGAF